MMNVSFDFKLSLWQRVKVLFGIPLHISWDSPPGTSNLTITVKGEKGDLRRLLSVQMPATYENNA